LWVGDSGCFASPSVGSRGRGQWLQQDELLDSLKKAPPERALKAATVYHMSGATQAEGSHNGYRRRSLVTDTGKSRSNLGVIAKRALSAADHQAPVTFPAFGARAPPARAPTANLFIV